MPLPGGDVLSADSSSQSIAPVDVLIVDDSLVARSVFERILEMHPDTRVRASVGSIDEALAVLATERVDVILLDIEMPGRGGIEGLPDLLARGQGARVLVVSAQVEEQGATAVAALTAGACDTLLKPGRRGYQGNFPRTLIDRVVGIGRRRDPAVLPAALIRSVETVTLARPDVIAIGGSTGAIGALATLLGALDPSVASPILVTQHLPATFVPFFVEQLARSGRRPVLVAVDGAPLLPHHVYVGPGTRHLGLRRGAAGPVLATFDGDYAVRYTPAVDALFETVADVAGDGTLAILLSGMGRDGLAGARRIAAAGGAVIAQDAASSVVWGMPGAVVRRGIASAAGDPAMLAAAISRSFR